jgi:hypothetical protein
MKLFFLLFLVGLLWSNNNALHCVYTTNQIRFIASQLTEVKNLINNLDTIERYQACSIEYGIVYPEKIFTVNFNIIMDAFVDVKVNTDVLHRMALTMASDGNIVDPASGEKLFSFTCDDQDACERQFWCDHIDWFIEEESNILEAAFRLILGTENQEKGKIDTFTTNRKVSR